MSRIVILAGSGSDDDHVAKIAAAAKKLGVEVIHRVGSAHKTPEHALTILRQYDTGPTVFVTVAGRSNALSGFAAANVIAPVIACPPPSEIDVWSSIRMPADVAPMLVLDPANAALAAAKILALYDPGVRERVVAHKSDSQATVLAADDHAKKANS